MRPIKFRVCDKLAHRYRQDILVDNDGDLYVFYGRHFTDLKVEDYIIEQFTGLHDKNGKEIYEGDIVKVAYECDESIHLVKYMIDQDYPAFDLEPYLDTEGNGLSSTVCLDTTIEVIGNIHENPELLEEK